MHVGRIIEEKGSDVLTAAPTATLAEIVETLAKHRVGAVLVTEGRAIRGIISERDIVRAVAKSGGDCLSETAADWMTAKVVTCRPGDSVNDVMQMMTDGRFRHLPVVDGGALVGIISIGDVVKRRIEQVEFEAEKIREYITTA